MKKTHKRFVNKIVTYAVVLFIFVSTFCIKIYEDESTNTGTAEAVTQQFLSTYSADYFYYLNNNLFSF